MSIAFAPISAAPIAGQKASSISRAFTLPWEDAAIVQQALTCRWFLESFSGVVVSQTLMPWGIPETVQQCAFPFESAFVHVGLEGRYGNEPIAVQWVLPYTEIFSVGAAVEFSWEPLPVVNRQWTEEYGTLFVQTGVAMPFGNAPVTAQCECPILAPVVASVVFPWTVLGLTEHQVAILWGSTVPVAGETAFPFDLLARNPVSRSLVEYWDLAVERPILQPNNLIRAFHQGVLL
ncbi:MAG: hypothetical protein HQL88_07285 [Magnetococcales bacterium]|nr:hypothetical protein [Magnetococcales bacterium]